MFILCITVSCSHFARNIFIYGPPVAITDIVNCLQQLCKYFIRICSVTSLYTCMYSYIIVGLIVTAPIEGYKKVNNRPL